MLNITLVCTHHSEIGKCNSDELCNIIDLINPEVLFEELPNNLFDKIYNENILGVEDVLEIKCIKKYLQNHDINNIPVDIDVNSNFSNEINSLFARFKKYRIYTEIEIEQKKMIAQEGFAYLNSDKCSELSDKKRIIEKRLLDFEGVYKNKLKNIYETFYKEQDERENAMLHNIYDYSKVNHYNQAVFFIGSAHRNSIMRKITEYQIKEKVKLNWTFYNGT